MSVLLAASLIPSMTRSILQFIGRGFTGWTKKEWPSVGAFGSFFFSLLLIPFFYQHLGTFKISALIVITLLISLVSQTGDLFISFLKRKARVKDTGDLLPGHGGFLDRIDGILFAVPFGLILFNFL